jgi:hypothetical protein
MFDPLEVVAQNLADLVKAAAAYFIEKPAEAILKKAQLPAFQSEQFFLNGKASSKTGQVTIAADDAMAWNDDGDGVGPVRKADRAGSLGLSDTPGKLAVAYGFAVRNLLQVPPDEQLKLGAFENQGEIEVSQLSIKVRLQLANCIFERRLVFSPMAFQRFGAAAVGEMYKSKAALIAGQQ